MGTRGALVPSALGNSTVLVVAVCYGILLHIARLGGILGILLYVLVTLSLWRYGYAVLRELATGRRNLVPPGMESMNPFGEMAVIFHCLLFFSLTILLVTTPFLPEGGLGVALRWLFLAGLAAVFPASAAIMGMTSNVAAAMSPASLLEVVRTLGRDYARLVVVAAAVVIASVWISEWLGTFWVLGLLAEGVAAWGFLALFVLTGAALREHRDDFDLVESLDDLDVREQRAREAEWQKTLDRAYASVRSGLPAQAYRTIKELLDSERDSLEIYQWTFNGMLAWDETRHAAQLGERFVARLWEEGRRVDAIELAQRCRALSRSFVLPAERAGELVAYARSIGRHRIADELAEWAASAGEKTT